MTAAAPSAEDVTVRRVVVRPSSVRGWISRDDHDEARHHESPEDVVRWVRRRDAAAARRGLSTVTVVEWTDVPAGFVPPAL